MSRPVRRFGDGALAAEVGSVTSAHALAGALARDPDWGAVEDVVVGYRSVTVVADPGAVDLAALAQELAEIPEAPPDPAPPRRVDIPVAFDGPDLDDVAARAAMTPGEVVTLITGTDLAVAFLGFLPGFAYLEDLPAPLAAVPRRSSPRPVVPAGAVAMAGGFAGIYPLASPGGWQLLGRSGFALFDPDRPPFATLGPGDRVRLVAVGDPGTVAPLERVPLRSAAAACAVVETPGLLSTVQDRGRVGVAGLGVPRAGAADPWTLRAANRLVGNADGAAALEMTAQGPRLRFTGPAHLAVVGGAGVTLDGRPVAADTVFPVAPGQVLSAGTMPGDLRGYLAVAGGFALDPVLGSRSTDVLTGLGPGALRADDVLGIGPPGRPRGQLVGPERHGGPRRLRVVPGPDGLDTDAAARLAGTTWEVGVASDRVGVRLVGGEPLAPPAGIASRGMVTGAVQVPPDGMPVVLGCDHATVGGYPVVATVVAADLGVLGRCRPGDAVRVDLVDLAEADRARLGAQRSLDAAVAGWYPVRSD